MLADVDDDVLEDLAKSKLESAALIRSLIDELSHRELIEEHQWFQLVESFVHQVLDETFSQFSEMYKGHWHQHPKDMRSAYEEYVLSWWNEKGVPDEPAESSEPDWPWPITEPGEGDTNSRGEIPFDHKLSALKMCGYSVARNGGLSNSERRQFLDLFFRNQLPSQVKTYFGNQYGEPGSTKRLKKMAEVIAANCRNFKRNDRIRYAFAIGNWENDLSYLKASYYDRGGFPWPEVEPHGE